MTCAPCKKSIPYLEKLSKVFGPRIPLFRDPNNLLSSVINPSRANEYLGKQTTDFIKGQQIFNKVCKNTWFNVYNNRGSKQIGFVYIIV